MKKISKILFSPAVTMLAFVLAAGLLLFGSIGGTQAALTYFSETYSSRMQMYDIGVTLLENGKRVSWRDYDYENADGTWDEHIIGELLGNMLAENERVQVDRAYTERLNVYNSGTINQYVRVSVYRFWLVENERGEWVKAQDLDPSLIDLHYVNLGTSWLEDVDSRTTERTVLYYNRLLDAGTETPLFADTLTIDGAVARQVEQTTLQDGTTRNIYTYQGARFCLDVRVDAVQENNANDAILSAWGKQISVNEDAGVLTLR